MVCTWLGEDREDGYLGCIIVRMPAILLVAGDPRPL
jgi:hypothetical protein